MSYKNTSIKSIVDKINISYFIPDIQREYVWLKDPKSKRIEQLFDSVMRGYPIGAFLFWTLRKKDLESDDVTEGNDKKLNFQLYEFIENYDALKPHNKKINVSQIVSNDLFIVLDGQQRLTSLYLGLRGSRRIKRHRARANNMDAYEEKQLYLNVKHKPMDDNPEDGYQFEFKTKDEVKNASPDQRWFKVGKVLDFEDREDCRDYCRKNGYQSSEEDMVEDLRVVVNKDDVISFYEETKKDLDKVLKIFIRVNSGGMQLSYSDLLMSLLTASFQSDIRTQMEEETEWMKDQGFECFGRDHILKTNLLLSECDHVFKLQNFSKSNIVKMEKNWNSIREYLHTTVSILKDLGYADKLSSGYIISVICYYLYRKSIRKPSYEDKKAIEKFVQTAQMRGYFSTSLDSKISKIKTSIDENSDFASFINEMNKLPDFGVGIEDIIWAVENVKYGDSAVFPILQLLYPTLEYDKKTFHIDHIFPKSKFKKNATPIPSEYKGKANELWNLQLLEGIPNIEKRDKDPEVWVSTQYTDKDDTDKDGSNSRTKYYESNYIPKECKPLMWENIAQFAEGRKQKMIDKLKDVFKLKEFNK